MLSWLHKALNVLGAKYMTDCLQNYKPSRPLRSPGTGLLFVTRARVTHSGAAFSFYAPNIWNKLTKNCRSAETLNALKIKPEDFCLQLPFIQLLFLYCTGTFILEFYNSFILFYLFFFPFFLVFHDGF